MQSATKDSWKTLPKPAKYAQLDYKADFTSEEALQIAEGVIPQCMEDKWFVYQEDRWLYLHRSWTGSLIYWLRIDKSAGGCYQVAEAHVSRDAEQYKETDLNYDAKLLDFIMRGILLQQDASFPKRDVDKSLQGLQQHHIAGSAFPEHSVKRPWWRFW